MDTDEDLGRHSDCLKPEERERFKQLWAQKIEADVRKKKAQCDLEIKIKLDEERRILAEIANSGNISEEVVRESFRRGIWFALILVFCSLGEFVFAKWTVSYFGLGYIEAHLVAITIVLISLEGFDIYLTSLRREYPHLEDRIFLVLGCIGIVAIFLLIFFAADIRQNLHKVTSLLSVASSLEGTVKHADQFHEQNSGSFISLMVCLTMAFTVIGGVSYHIAKNRILVSMPHLKRYKSLRAVRNEIRIAGQQMISLDSRVPQFMAGFEVGLMKKQSEEMKKAQKSRNKGKGVSQTDNRKARIGPFLAFPFTLIILAIIIFFFLSGEAKGEEYIVPLDVSKSLDVNDYSGKETEFQKNVKAVETFIRNKISAGDTLKVIGITENSFSRPYILLDARISQKKGAFGEDLARGKLRLLNRWKKLNLSPTAVATDIFGAVNLAAMLFSENSKKKVLIFFSDMRQCAHGFNLEKPQKIDSERILRKVNKMGLIPDLEGVKVHCLGVHSAGRTPAYWISLKDFWTRYFKQAKAELSTFSIERRLPHE